MKIAVVGTRGIPDIQGGIETHCQHLYPRLVKMGVDVTIYARSCYTPQKEPYEYEGVKIVPLSAPRKAGMEAIFHTFRCFLEICRHRPDIVHVHAIGPSLFVPLFRLIGVKTIYTHHGRDYDRAKWGKVAKNILKLGEFLGTHFANKVIVISEYLQRWLQEKYHCNRTAFIRNGVEIPPILSPDVANKYLDKYGIQRHQYVFALGRFVEEKAFHDLVLAFAKTNHGEKKLVIAGAADHESEYSRRLVKLAQENGVVLPGFIHGVELQALFQNAGLFVIPSYHEGLPIVLLEALSHNLDVVASDIPANTEVPLPKDCFFPVGNISVLSAKIEAKWAKSEQPNYLNLVREFYNWDKIAEQTYSVYVSVSKK